MITRKSKLTRELSKIEGFLKPKLSLRQYMTPPAIASELLWTAYMNGDIEGREVCDLGAGTGMLTIGASLLGGRVTGYEIDSEAIRIAISNAHKLKARIIILQMDVDEVTDYCNTIIMNPPFMVIGGKNDKVFLKKAFTLSERVYSIHTTQTRSWIKKYAESNGYNAQIISTREFPLPKEFKHQSKELVKQEVDLWYFFR